MGRNYIDLEWSLFAKTPKSLLAVALIVAAVQVDAANHYVPASVSTVDCSKYGGGVVAGDTITLAAGNRGPLRIEGCTGRSDAKIIIRNDSAGNGPTIIRRSSASSGGFIFTCTNCVHVLIDGTAKWLGAPPDAYCGAPSGRDGCGIKVTAVATNDSPTSFIRLNGLSTKITVRGVEIDGRASDLRTTGVGIHQNDQAIKINDYPNFWREDITYEKSYIHNVFGEGMYIGPNWREPDLGIPLRNITIRQMLVEDTGRENIQLKSAIDGLNRIHHNVVRRSGLRNEGPVQGAGISVTEGGNVQIFNNWVEASGVQGIQHYTGDIPGDRGPFSSEIYNNVVYSTGNLGGANSNGHGITLASRDGSAELRPTVYNNTVVKTSQDGINFGSRVVAGEIRDNIVSEWGTTALSVQDNRNVNNRVGSLASIRFADADRLNFSLAADSPARNSGSPSGFPPNDYRDIKRPQGNVSDQGAFEFSSEIAEPSVPELVEVQ